MRTLIIIVGGLVLWAICLGVGKLAGGTGDKSPLSTATIAFIALWFAVAAINMWIGVTQAGYGFMEELPIFFVIFLIPAAVAVFVKWKFL